MLSNNQYGAHQLHVPPASLDVHPSTLLSNAGIPSVLRSELYAVAALVGATVMVIGNVLQVHAAWTALVGAAGCFGLRMAAIRYRIRLPVARASPPKDL